ncbi:hypothetical protein SAMN05421872_103179 [Nocardioides lianchengensis]|uniref:Uncharacterized protein n=1 Tax=Nocardioides lianchengensis TaxID=1045774 RepID=A0A1G6N9R5_9ACTN|nr:hypothetical protein SAMN05421872_103179 [Nocardioides lianchengensis]
MVHDLEPRRQRRHRSADRPAQAASTRIGSGGSRGCAVQMPLSSPVLEGQPGDRSGRHAAVRMARRRSLALRPSRGPTPEGLPEIRRPRQGSTTEGHRLHRPLGLDHRVTPLSCLAPRCVTPPGTPRAEVRRRSDPPSAPATRRASPSASWSPQRPDHALPVPLGFGHGRRPEAGRADARPGRGWRPPRSLVDLRWRGGARRRLVGVRDLVARLVVRTASARPDSVVGADRLLGRCPLAATSCLIRRRERASA